MVFPRTLVTNSAISALNRSISWHWLARAWWRISSATLSPCETSGRGESELDHWSQHTYWELHIIVPRRPPLQRSLEEAQEELPGPCFPIPATKTQEINRNKCRKSRTGSKALAGIWQNRASFFCRSWRVEHTKIRIFRVGIKTHRTGIFFLTEEITL